MNTATANAAPHPLHDWAQRIRAAPVRSVLGAGHVMLATGAIAALCGSLISIALVHIGTGLMVLGALLARPPIHRLAGFRLGCAFAAWVALSILAGWMESGQKPKHLSVLHLWLLFPLGVAAFATPAARRWGKQAVAIAIIASVVLATLQALSGYNINAGPLRIDPESAMGLRVSGFLGHILIFGSNLVVLGLLFPPPWWLAFIAIIGVTLALAKTAFVALAGGLALKVWHTGGPTRWLAPLVVTLVLGGGFMLSRVADPRLEHDTNLPLSNGRMTIWQHSASMVVHQPLLGTGSPKAWQAAYSEIVDKHNSNRNTPTLIAQHAHNGPLIIASTYGLPAALFFFGLVLFLLWGAPANSAGNTARAIGVAWLLAGCFENMQVSTLGAACGWLSMALSGAWSPSTSLPEEHHPDGSH